MSLLKTAGIQHPSVATQSITINASTGEVTFPNNTIGDVTAVAAGTGISVASSAGPVPTVSIDTSVTADLTTAQTLTNKTLTSPAINTATFTDGVVKGLEEDVNIVASAATGTINFDVSTASVWYYTTNATANHTLNFRYSSGVSLNDALACKDKPVEPA